MKSLFLRIFVSFWATLALFLVLATLVTIAMRPNRRGAEIMGPQILAEAVSAYQSGGERGAFAYVEELQRTQHVRVFVFDPAGRELSGRMPPPWIEDIRRGMTPPHHPWIASLLPDRFLRQGLTLDGKRYTLVLELAGRRGPLSGPHEIPGLGLTILVISSGLVCSLLAWSLTSPVTRLRKAAQSLAAGDLKARAGAPLGHRRDELAQLMCDFDRMADRIEGLVESQSRLLNDVSHELRSPLARLSVALGLAQQKAGPEVVASLNRIELEADRLNQLIQRLLTISRLESGADGIRKSRVSLRELVDHIARDAEYETPGSACRVSAEDSDEFLVEGDHELLHSAIENVVRNATRYTAEGTEVQIRLEHQPNKKAAPTTVIRVLDSGPGVPNEALDKIFQPFYRLDDARNRQTGGAGLGLSIADRAVRLHGGQVRASNRPGGGLEVEIRIPSLSGFALPAHS
jgi:two-component system, OmpR family, sensor histidine kinase CpxA